MEALEEVATEIFATLFSEVSAIEVRAANSRIMMKSPGRTPIPTSGLLLMQEESVPQLFALPSSGVNATEATHVSSPIA